MTSGQRAWTFDPNARADVLHLIDHRACALDGDVGPVVLVSAQPNRAYVLVKDDVTDRQVILPAGSIAGHDAGGAVRLCLTRQQIDAAPSFDVARRNEREYFEMLAALFAPMFTHADPNGLAA